MSALESAESIEPIADIFFKKALDLNPKSGLFWTTYGIHLAQSRRPDFSIWALQLAVASGDGTAYFPLSMQYYLQGEKQDALDALEKYSELDPETKAHAAGIREAMEKGTLDVNAASSIPEASER
jgi:tetratricopeptide (TPR) repeat protein